MGRRISYPLKITVLALSGILILAVIQGYTSLRTPPDQSLRGPQSVVVVRARLPGLEHEVADEYINNLVFDQASQYYRANSWNQVWLTGTSTNKSYVLNLPSSSFKGYVSSADVRRVASEAVKASDPDVDFRGRRAVVVVLPGRILPHMIQNLGVMSDDRVVVDKVAVLGEKTLSLGVLVHELAHSFGLPDLYRDGGEVHDPNEVSKEVGPWCILSQAEPLVGISSWARIKLGWIPQDRIADLSMGESGSFILTPLESPPEGVQVIRLRATPSLYYLVEARLRVAYDSMLPQEGVVVFRVDETLPPGEGGITVVRINPEKASIGDAAMDFAKGRTWVYNIPGQDVSVAVTGRSEGKFLVKVGNVLEGQTAMAGGQKILQTNDTIHWIASEAFQQGIDEARKTLDGALTAYALGKYVEASELATKANTTALTSKWSEEMITTSRLITRMEAKLKQADSISFKSAGAQKHLSLAAAELASAKEAWSAGRYQEATLAVDTCRNHLGQALIDELILFPERNEELSNFARV